MTGSVVPVGRADQCSGGWPSCFAAASCFVDDRRPPDSPALHQRREDDQCDPDVQVGVARDLGAVGGRVAAEEAHQDEDHTVDAHQGCDEGADVEGTRGVLGLFVVCHGQLLLTRR